MKSGQVGSIVHDIIYFRDWKNPLNHVRLGRKIEFDLLTGESNVDEEDSITEMCKNKREWFLDRLKKFNSKIEDFEEAKIVFFRAKEKVIIRYKGKLFEKERVYEDDTGKIIKKFREDMRK